MNTSDCWEPTEEEIEEIVNRHETWLRTNHEEGEKANLVGADLINVDLRYRNLREAELQGADPYRALHSTTAPFPILTSVMLA